MDELDEDDLDLINEARGLPTKMSQQAAEDDAINQDDTPMKQKTTAAVKGRNEQELSRGLFTGDTDDEDDNNNNNGINSNKGSKGSSAQNKSQQSSSQPERYDEDGLDDFIEDDVGGEGYADAGGGDDVMATGGMRQGVSERMLQEHLDIFGTDFMDFMEGTKDGENGDEDDDEYLLDDEKKRRRRRKKKDKYREEGVGVDLNVDSDDDIYDDDDDDSLDVTEDEEDSDADLFGDDDVMDQDDMGDKQRAEVLKLKREKKKMAREQRRKERNARIEAKRRAQLRRAFEPVQLVENFCTERDDAIRIVDSPERYYDWLDANPLSAANKVLSNIHDEITDEEDEESFWIMQKIPAIQGEWAAASNILQTPTADSEAMTDADVEKKERAVLSSIVYALRYMRIEKVEPEFIRRYRKDYVTSPAVQSNLYRIVDEHTEYDRMSEARAKIEGILMAENNKGSVDDEEGEELITLKSQLDDANVKLDKTINDETRVKIELEEAEEAVATSDGPKTKAEDDDDDDLFGDDDDDEDDEAVGILSSSFL